MGITVRRTTSLLVHDAHATPPASSTTLNEPTPTHFDRANKKMATSNVVIDVRNLGKKFQVEKKKPGFVAARVYTSTGS